MTLVTVVRNYIYVSFVQNFMVEINYSRLPPQRGFVVELDAIEPHTNLGQADDQTPPRICRPIGTNDMHVTYARADEGDILPWHTHNQAMYQIIVQLEGRRRQYYKDNNGDVHSTEVGPGEMLYLPNGAHNRVEYIEGPSRSFAIECHETWNARMDQVVGPTSDEASSDNTYDPADPHWGLWYDNLRDVVHSVDENAVREY